MYCLNKLKALELNLHSTLKLIWAIHSTKSVVFASAGNYMKIHFDKASSTLICIRNKWQRTLTGVFLIWKLKRGWKLRFSSLALTWQSPGNTFVASKVFCQKVVEMFGMCWVLTPGWYSWNLARGDVLFSDSKLCDILALSGFYDQPFKWVKKKAKWHSFPQTTRVCTDQTRVWIKRNMYACCLLCYVIPRAVCNIFSL